MTTIYIRSRWNNDTILFECEAPDGLESGMHMRHALEKAVASGSNLRGSNLRGSNLRGSNLRGSNLSGSNLRGSNLRGSDLSGSNLSDSNLRGSDLSDSNLRGFRADFWDVLLRAPAEISGVRAALVEGRVDGSTYSGECACLVGTIGNVRHADYASLGNGLEPDSGRPAEKWFMSIKKGDTPETNQCSKLAVEWLDELVGLLRIESNEQYRAPRPMGATEEDKAIYQRIADNYAAPVAAEPVGYVNGDQLDNMLSDRTAVIQPMRDGWRSTPLYKEPPVALAPQSPQPASEAVSNWREAIDSVRLGLGAGSRSMSNTDFEVDFGGALLDAVAERLEVLALRHSEAAIEVANDIKAAITELANGRDFPDLLEAVDSLAALAAHHAGAPPAGQTNEGDKP